MKKKLIKRMGPQCGIFPSLIAVPPSKKKSTTFMGNKKKRKGGPATTTLPIHTRDQ